MSERGFDLGRPAIVMSLALHVGVFIVAVGVPRLLASSSPPPIYVVDLVSPPGPAGPAAAAPAPAAAPAKAAPPKATPTAKATVPPKKAPAKPILLPDKNVKKAPEKKAPEKKPEPVKTATPPEPEAGENAADEDKPQPENPEKPDTASAKPQATTPNPNTTAAAAGAAQGAAAAPGAGGTGSGPGGGGDEYAFYLSLLKKAIEDAWTRPVYTGTDTKSATVSLSLSRAGRVLKLELSHPSGYEPLDRSLLRAVRDAEPFRPFPVALTLDTLTVQIDFDLKPEGTDTGDTGG